MATDTTKPPKQERPTPGPGDTNTPQQVAAVNNAAELVDNPQQGGPAPQGASAEEPQPLMPIQTARPDTSPAEQYSNEKDHFLFGPSIRPGESILTGSNARTTRPAVSQDTLAALRAAASDPAATPALRNMYQLLVYHMGQN